MRIKEIVDQINQTLRLTLNQEKFQRGIFHGLAKLIIRQEENSSEDSYLSVIYDSTGKEIRCQIDDAFPFKIYHRCLTVTPAPSNSLPQFGDGNNTIKEVANMIAIVYGKKSVIGLTQEDLASIILTSFPDHLSITGINQTVIKNGVVNNDSFSVYNQEYKKTDYPLDPEDYYFSYSYTVETTYDKSCVDACLVPQSSQVTILSQACTCISSEVKFVNGSDGVTTVAGQNTYSIPELLGMSVVFVQLSNMVLVNEPARTPAFIQHSLTGINFKIEDTTFPIEAGQKLIIGYIQI